MKHTLPTGLVVALTATASLLPAQTWTELGDAGQTLDFAQVVDLPGIVATITGQNNADADLYLIDVPYPTSFSAVAAVPFDAQLWVFDQRGMPVVSNDDQGNGGPLNPALALGCIKTPGRYYLAISPYNYNARSLAGSQWFNTPYAAEPPDGPGRLEPLSSWTGTSVLAGNYSITLTGAYGVARHAVLPSTHYLSESQVQTTGTGTTAWFDNDGGRFQILYEASNFAAAGVTGVIDLKRIMFRAEDGQAHPGGMYFPSMSVLVAKTSLTAAAMSANFATNLASPASTPLMSTYATQVHVRPSLGSVPNNYNMVLDVNDFSGPPTLLHDLSGPQPATRRPGPPLSAA